MFDIQIEKLTEGFSRRIDILYQKLMEKNLIKNQHHVDFKVLFYVMIFETTFQNLVVLIIKIKADIFCYMRFALFRNNN